MEKTNYDDAVIREVYKKVHDLFSAFEGTLSESVERFGMSSHQMFYRSDIVERMMDVADGKMSRERAKDWLKAFVELAYMRAKREGGDK